MLTDREARQRSEEIFDSVWPDDDLRQSWNALDDCISDLYGWAEEVESDPGPYKASNEKIAAELRKLAERLSHIDPRPEDGFGRSAEGAA